MQRFKMAANASVAILLADMAACLRTCASVLVRETPLKHADANGRIRSTNCAVPKLCVTSQRCVVQELYAKLSMAGLSAPANPASKVTRKSDAAVSLFSVL